MSDRDDPYPWDDVYASERDGRRVVWRDKVDVDRDQIRRVVRDLEQLGAQPIEVDAGVLAALLSSICDDYRHAVTTPQWDTALAIALAAQPQYDLEHRFDRHGDGRGAACRAMKTIRTWLVLRREGRGLSLLAVARGWQ